MQDYRPRCLLLTFALTLAGCGGGASTPAPPTTPPTPRASFLYAAGDGQILSFAIDSSSGALGAATINPGPGKALTFTPTMVADPGGKFLFALDATKAMINTYSINPSTGSLTQLSVTQLGLGPISLPETLAIDPQGKFIYVGGAFGVLPFGVSSTGTLAAIPDSLPGAVNPTFRVVVAPSGKFSYSSNFDGLSGSAVTVSAFAMNAEGSLSQVPGSPFPASLSGIPMLIAVHPSGKFLYLGVLAVPTPSATPGTLEAWSIDGPTGGLAALADSPFVVSPASDVFCMAMSPDGKFMYVCRASQAAIAGFHVDTATGRLAQMNESPFATTAINPSALVVDPDGRALYGASPNGIVEFKIDSTTGALTKIAATGLPPSSLTLPTTLVIAKIE